MLPYLFPLIHLFEIFVWEFVIQIYAWQIVVIYRFENSYKI